MMKSNNRNQVKNTILTLDIVMSGITDFGESYNPDQLRDIITELSNIEVTKLISIPIYGRKSEIIGPEKRGTMIIGYLVQLNNNDTAKIAIYPKYANLFGADSYIKPRIMLDKKEKYVRQIIEFDVMRTDGTMQASN